MAEPTLHTQQIQAPSTDQFDRLSPEQRRFQLRLDLARRAGQGESIRVEGYLEMYPSLREDTELLLDLLTSEVSLRTGQGESVPLEELRERFPQLADSVSRLMAPASVNAEAGTIPPPGSSEAGTLPPVSASEDATIAPAAGPSPGPSSSVQREIAGYEVLGELGRGGMGVVYKARQKGLNRLVALKMILHADHAGSDEQMRFEREAQAIARLEHPNIVQVYEIGEHEGKPYFSLEYVSGGALDKKLDRKPMDATQASGLIETLARGMAAAHRADVIHRDLKPANVLITEEGVPKITDFGLAKNLGEAGQTQSGAIMGTPSYMAPEQAAGKSQAMGPGVDIYALGAILYECLTGRPPFRAATAMDAVLQVISQPAPPPSQLRPDIPKDLETICLKCLEKEPQKRYETAELLVEDRRRFQNGEPISARPVGRAEKLWRWCKRSPAVASLLLLVMVLLLAGSGVSTWFAIEAFNRARSEKNARERAEKATEEANKALAKATFVNYAFQIDQAQQAAHEGDFLGARVILGGTEPTLRGWEHHFVYHQTMPTALMVGHTQEVNSVAFSPDGKRIVSGGGVNQGTPGELKVWDATTGEELLTLKGHTSYVTSAAFSPDGKRIVSGTGEVRGIKPGEVKVWDAITGEELLTLKGHAGFVSGVGFSPDGKRIVSRSSDRTVKVWDATTGQVTLTLKKDRFVLSAAFSPDGKHIVTGSGVVNSKLRKYIGEVKVRDANTGKEVLTVKGNPGYVTSVAFSPDGKRIVSGNYDNIVKDGNIVKVWDATTGQGLFTLKGHTDRVSSVAFSPDGKRIVSGSNDSTVKVWDAMTGEEALTLKGHTRGVSSVSFSPDGESIVSGGGRAEYSSFGELKVWDAETGEVTLTLKGHRGYVHSVAYSPDGKSIVSGGADKTVRVWDATTGLRAFTLTEHTGSVHSVAFSPDGKWIISGSQDKTIKVWEASPVKPKP